MLTASQRAAELTAKLLAFARKGKYRSVSVDVHELLHEVVEILRHSIDKKVGIKQALKAHPSTVRGDPTQLQSALLNLAINAADAMPNGGNLVFSTDVVRVDEDYCQGRTHDMAPGPYLQICVSDTGCGIASADQSRIFEPFFTTKEPGKGTGMGLAAVYGTVKQHHGAIDVYSEVGKGTTFKILLPVEYAPAEQVQRIATVVPAPRDATILLVDDERTIRALGEDMLGGLGYRVITREHGAAAVEFYREHWKEIDLVVLDIIMPEMSGPEACRAMQEINPEVKVLLCSGYSMDGMAESLMADGVCGFLQKPFDRVRLSVQVAEAIAP